MIDNDMVKALRGTKVIEPNNRGLEIRKIKGFYSGSNVFVTVNYTRSLLDWFGTIQEAHQHCIEASIG